MMVDSKASICYQSHWFSNSKSQGEDALKNMGQELWVESDLEHTLHVVHIPRNSVTSFCISGKKISTEYSSLNKWFPWKLCHGNSGVVWKALTGGAWLRSLLIHTIAWWKRFKIETQWKELLLMIVKGVCKWSWLFPCEYVEERTMNSKPALFYGLGSGASNTHTVLAPHGCKHQQSTKSGAPEGQRKAPQIPESVYLT